jgi:hypothetical protein
MAGKARKKVGGGVIKPEWPIKKGQIVRIVGIRAGFKVAFVTKGEVILVAAKF